MTATAPARHVRPPADRSRRFRPGRLARVLGTLRSAHPADVLRRLRSAHPSRVLRWLRNGALLCVAVAALLYLWVAVQAGSDIGTAQRAGKAIAALGTANVALTRAQAELATMREEVAPLGNTISDVWVTDINQVSSDLSLAAENNVAGAAGTQGIQYTGNLLTDYLGLGENAIHAYGDSSRLGDASKRYALDDQAQVANAITRLRAAERTALTAERTSWALNSALFWPVLLGPVVVLLAVFVATTGVLTRHFRRCASRLLWGSLLLTALIMIAAAIVNGHDARIANVTDRGNNAVVPLAGYPASIAVVLLLLATAAALVHGGYRPRLAEYRFDPS